MLINFTDPMFSNRVLGFETLVDRLERISNESQSSYPPYNIYKDGLKFQIEIALAGIDKKDVDIELCDGILTITHNNGEETNSNTETVHRGIAKRSFKLKFTFTGWLIVFFYKFFCCLLFDKFSSKIFLFF